MGIALLDVETIGTLRVPVSVQVSREAPGQVGVRLHATEKSLKREERKVYRPGHLVQRLALGMGHDGLGFGAFEEIEDLDQGRRQRMVPFIVGLRDDMVGLDGLLFQVAVDLPHADHAVAVQFDGAQGSDTGGTEHVYALLQGHHHLKSRAGELGIKIAVDDQNRVESVQDRRQHVPLFCRTTPHQVLIVRRVFT